MVAYSIYYVFYKFILMWHFCFENNSEQCSVCTITGIINHIDKVTTIGYINIGGILFMQQTCQ